MPILGHFSQILVFFCRALFFVVKKNASKTSEQLHQHCFFRLFCEIVLDYDGYRFTMSVVLCPSPWKDCIIVYVVNIYLLCPAPAHIFNHTFFRPRALVLLSVYVTLLALELWSMVGVLQHLMAKLISIINKCLCVMHHMVWSVCKNWVPTGQLVSPPAECRCNPGQSVFRKECVRKIFGLEYFKRQGGNKSQCCALSEGFPTVQVFVSPLILPSQNWSNMA